MTTSPPPTTTTDAGTGANLYTPDRAEINRMAAEAIGYTVRKMDGDFYALIDPKGHSIAFSMCQEESGEMDTCQSWRFATGTTEEEAWAFVERFFNVCSPDCPHSLTAQLLAKVEAAGRDSIDKWYLFLQTDYSALWNGNTRRVLECVQVSPLVQTVACLRALGVWPSAWGEPTP